MSKQDRDKWNQRYAENGHHNDNPARLIEDWLSRLPVGRALDVACGAGRNSIYLAQAGFRVDAIDISREGLNQGRQKAEEMELSINWIEHDLDLAYQFDTEYDLIVILGYVNLALITSLCGCLASGGYLLCEEHLVTDLDVIGPTSLDYRVASGDLLKAVSGVDVLLYQDTIEINAEGERVASARVVVKKI